MSKQKTIVTVLLAVLVASALAIYWTSSVRIVPILATRPDPSSSQVRNPAPREQTNKSAPTNDADLIRKKDAAQDQKDRRLALTELYSRLQKEGKLAEYAHSLEISLRGDQRDRTALEELYLLYRSPELKDEEKAYQFLHRFVKYDKEPKALLRLSQYEAQRTNTQAAYELATEAAKLQPERATAYRLDGAIFLDNAGDVDRSAKICQQIITDPTADGRGLLYAGDKLSKLGRLDLAQQAYDLAVQRADHDNIKQRAEVGLYRIRAHTEGLSTVRPALEALAENGVTPLIQQQARSLLTNQSLKSR